jgi:magnesium chelatase family protein
LKINTHTYAIQSASPPAVARCTVEVDVRPGLPSFTIVAAPDRMVRETRERVRCALLNSGFEFPCKRVTVNIAPAHVRRVGAEADLAIACALLAATGQAKGALLDSLALFGELSLGGEIRATRGALLAAEAARAHGLKTLVLASGRAREAALVEGLDIAIADHLRDAVGILAGNAEWPAPVAGKDGPSAASTIDLCEIRGQQEGVRAMTLAAAGGHSLLLVGAPGSGRTMLANRLVGILPGLSETEALEVTRLASIVGDGDGAGLVRERPFRAPHHSISADGLTGSTTRVRVGEVQRANHGVLFLDDLGEFPDATLTALSETLATAQPCQLTLVGAVSPCPGACGAGQDCRCDELDRNRYRRRMDALLDGHFDVVVRLAHPDLSSEFDLGPTSQDTRDLVTRARAVQHNRQAALNAGIDRGSLRNHVALSPDVSALVKRACVEQRLTDRDLDRLLRVARTAADLDASPHIQAQHALAALSLRGGLAPLA